jgi:hypothetical protein
MYRILRRRVAKLAPFALLVGSISACTINYDRSTSVLLRDPSDVSIESHGDVILPRGHDTKRAELARGDMPLGADASARYRLEVTRGPRRGISLFADTHIPLANGDTHTIVDDEGRVARLATPSIAGPTAGVLDLPLCVDRSMRVNQPCGADSLERFSLVTPEKNVVEVRSTSRNLDRAGATATFVVMALPALVASVWVTAATGDEPELRYGVGVPLTTVTAAFASFCLYAALSPSTTEVTYPR